MQNTVEEIAHDLDLPASDIRYRVAGVNHVAFFLSLEHEGRDLYPLLREGYRAGRLPKPAAPDAGAAGTGSATR